MKTDAEIDAILQPSLTNLREELKTLRAPVHLETQLMATFVEQYPKVPWYRQLMQKIAAIRLSLPIAGGLAGGALATILFFTAPVTQHAQLIQSSAIADDEYGDIPFIAIGSNEEILQQPSLRVVRAEVPHTVLASMGMRVNPQNAGGFSRAEMVLGSNDEPLAMRFLPN